MLARAKYSNDAETPDELSFRHGDIVTVVQLDFNGLDGWWLCSLRGKTGIAPGNRLQPVTGQCIAPGNRLQPVTGQYTAPGNRLQPVTGQCTAPGNRLQPVTGQ